jgi:PAS domain S-box-containing protein
MQAVSRDRVLLVDDEPQVLIALEDLLGDDFVVFTAGSAERALTLVEKEPDIAVVVSDQRMPQMTGDELLARLATSSDATRILVTGFADLSAVIRAVNNGKIFSYVTKPWNPEDLRVTIGKAAEHFRLSKELAYERSLLHDLMDSTPDGIYFKDRDLRFLRVNRAFAFAMNSLGPERLVGNRLSELRSVAVDTAEIETEERRILSEGRAALAVMREYSTPTGTLWLSETKAPVRGVHGEVLGLVGISRDMTEQRSLEQQFRQAQKMEAVGQLAGGVAHDFNNVLAVIQSYGALLLQQLPADDSKRADVGEILAATQRASVLTRQLLAFSRQQITQPRIISLNAVVADIENMLRRIIGEHIELTTVLSDSLGMVRADAGQIEQILMNLTVNARDAMPEGGKLTIETSNVQLDHEFAVLPAAVSSGEFVMLAVTDTGTGMDAETQKRIFEPFFTTKDVGKGTGLGLSTVHGIVQQSGGHIRMYSELERGTSFKVCLPRAYSHGEAPRARHPSAPPAVGVGTILVVEDDDAVRQVTMRILRESGYVVLEARRASEALDLGLKRGASIDLLLTDVVMPGLNGPKLAEELRRACPRLRVLYMSGYPGTSVSRDGSLEPGTGYLEKPFSPGSLTAKIREILDSEQ